MFLSLSVFIGSHSALPKLKYFVSPFQMPVGCPFYYDSLNLPSRNISFSLNVQCLVIRPSSIVYSVFFMINVAILIPTCTCICYLGIQQWHQQRSISSASAKSHTDILTYHMVVIELFGVVGFIFCCYEVCCNIDIVIVGYYIWTFSWFGETFFHLLICLERYLAVVHPITYRSLRTERGIRIRNISIGNAWLLCFVGTILITEEMVFIRLTSWIAFLTLFVISFCTLSVLCILIRPGPGKQCGKRGRLDQSKKKAFIALISILGSMFLRCLWNITWSGLNEMVVMNECFVMMFGTWFNAPCTLVIPLLYLQKNRAFSCCKCNSS
ncbi:uncharacterized protein LOC130523144 [Takifugu flavidus]|uniref:uncharacterized protein LOC130523144 n=1 Tax=Takifugu flavidus TaxID=433684 RepID=UPI00254419B5|nr:uncharacterized protein LOC130523144 [Takifugu flavidus]